MTPPLRLHDAAVSDFLEAAAWYESQNPRAARRFNDAINAALDQIELGVVALTPLPQPLALPGLRRFVVRRFPYQVVVHESDGSRLVLAIAHHAREPAYWMDRLPY